MTDKITIERDFLEHAVVALEYAYSADDEMVQESIKFLRAALAAQPAEAPSMPQGKSLALLDLDSVEHMQGGANGPTIRLRGFINAQTGPTAPQPPIDNAFVAEGCEQFSPLSAQDEPRLDFPPDHKARQLHPAAVHPLAQFKRSPVPVSRIDPLAQR